MEGNKEMRHKAITLDAKSVVSKCSREGRRSARVCAILHMKLRKDVADKGRGSRSVKGIREGGIYISGEEHSRKRESHKQDPKKETHQSISGSAGKSMWLE